MPGAKGRRYGRKRLVFRAYCSESTIVLENNKEKEENDIIYRESHVPKCQTGLNRD